MPKNTNTRKDKAKEMNKDFIMCECGHESYLHSQENNGCYGEIINDGVDYEDLTGYDIEDYYMVHDCSCPLGYNQVVSKHMEKNNV